MTQNDTILGPEPTHAAIIFCGLKNTKTGVVHPRSALDDVCQRYVDTVGLCVSVRDIDYIYTNGREPGISVTLINYPPFPSTPEIIRRHAVALAEKLRVAAVQERVTVMTSKDTITLQDRSLSPEQAQPAADPFAHINDIDVRYLHDKAPFIKELARRDRETLLMLCCSYVKRHEDIDHRQACARMQERNRQLELQLRGARHDKTALADLADYREKQVIRLSKRITELEWAIAEMAKKIWWPRIRSLARFVLSGSIRD